MTRIQTGWAALILIAAVVFAVRAPVSGTAAEPPNPRQAAQPEPKQVVSPAPSTRKSEPARVHPTNPLLTENGGIIKGPPTVTAEQVRAWRKQYPYQSLAGRLDYEAERAPKTSPPMTELTKLFTRTSEGTTNGSIGRVRGDSFRLLHEEEVEKFVEQSGFGRVRMISIEATRNSKYYELPEVKPLLPNRMPELSDDGPRLELPMSYEAERAAVGSARMMPNIFDLRDLQSTSRAYFVDSGTFGYVKSIEQVVGFAPHEFRLFPRLPVDKARFVRRPTYKEPQNYWKLVRLELVSLLKHDTPRVYLSEHLPRMEELSSARTRELSKFEAESLEKLHTGEGLIVVPKLNRIEMFGALRASGECCQCHKVPQGTMLGAFSYDLRRDPPIDPIPANVTGQ